MTLHEGDMPQLRSGARPAPRQAALEAKAKLAQAAEPRSTRGAAKTAETPKGAAQQPRSTRGGGSGKAKKSEPAGKTPAVPPPAAEMKKDEGQAEKDKHAEEKAKEEEASTAPLPEKVGAQPASELAVCLRRPGLGDTAWVIRTLSHRRCK